MRRYTAGYRVRVTSETQERVEALSRALSRSEADVLRKLVEVALTAPPSVLEAAGLTPAARTR